MRAGDGRPSQKVQLPAQRSGYPTGRQGSLLASVRVARAAQRNGPGQVPWTRPELVRQDDSSRVTARRPGSLAGLDGEARTGPGPYGVVVAQMRQSPVAANGAATTVSAGSAVPGNVTTTT